MRKIMFFDVIIECIYRIPIIKKRYKKLGITPQDVQTLTDDMFRNPETGIDITYAGGYLTGVFAFFFFEFVIVFDALIHGGKTGWISEEFVFKLFCISGVFSFIISYVFVFKERKYLKYFKKFRKWDKRKKIQYGLLSFLFVAFVLVFLLYSFSYIKHS